MGTHSIWCLSSKQSSSVCLCSLFVKYKMEEEKYKCLVENMFFLIFYFSYFFSLSFSVYHFCSYSFFTQLFSFSFHTSHCLSSPLLTQIPYFHFPGSRSAVTWQLSMVAVTPLPLSPCTTQTRSKSPRERRSKRKPRVPTSMRPLFLR